MSWEVSLKGRLIKGIHGTAYPLLAGEKEAMFDEGNDAKLNTHGEDSIYTHKLTDLSEKNHIWHPQHCR